MSLSHVNPTPIQVGMHGELGGLRYRVAGRVVLSMEEGGQTYTWNEYNLAGPDGSDATLVYEETGDGPQWRLFRLIEPAHVISAAEAATKRVGDTVNLTGDTLRISCVDESRVIHIEGEAPEGVETGDVARYFNAESGNQMIVVSWTGDEVEVFRGLNLPGHAVLRAFGVDHTPSAPHAADEGRKKSSANRVVSIVIFCIMAGMALIPFLRTSRGTSRAAPKPPKPPEAQLRVGAEGTIGETRHRIIGRVLVEIGRVGRRHARHEFSVEDESGNQALLVQGMETGPNQWLWLRPFTPASQITPREAGAKKLGDVVSLDDGPMKVTSLFHTRVLGIEGVVDWPAGTELYGLEARTASGDSAVVVRWDEKTVTFFRRAPASARDIAAVFRTK